jgi:hypothetical protein
MGGSGSTGSGGNATGGSATGGNAMGGSATGGASTGGSGGSCAGNLDVDFELQIPTVTLLVDRSGSMGPDSQFADAPAWDCAPDDNDWRWNATRYALFHPTEGVIKPLESKVRFGMTLYSGDDGGASHPAGLGSGTCPLLSGITAPALNNHADMIAGFPCSSMLEDTPTGPSLHAAATALAQLDVPGPKIIVLATDGEPDDCACPDFNTDDFPECGDAEADAVKAAVVVEAHAVHQDHEITVHVIQIAENDVSLWQHVQAVADAGGGNAYEAYDVGALKQAFQAVFEGARNCKLDLTGSIAAGAEASGSVTLGGSSLTLDDPNGYRINSSSQLELLGTACAALETDAPDLAIAFPCGGFVASP